MNEHETIVEVVIAAAPDAVWEAMRDPEQIANWHGWDGEGDALAAEIDEIYVRGVTVDEDARTLDVAGVQTRFTVVPAAGGAVLRVTKPGPVDAETWDEIDQGWITFVQQLKFWLERHPGAVRRTFHVAGPGTLGERFLAAGDEPVFRTAHQTGTAWGEALVAVHHRPDGGSRVIVSVYGLDDAEVAAMRRSCEELVAAS